MNRFLKKFTVFIVALVFASVLQIVTTPRPVEADEPESYVIQELDKTWSAKYVLSVGNTARYHRIEVPSDGRVTLSVRCYCPTLYTTIYDQNLETIIMRRTYLGGGTEASYKSKNYVFSLSAGIYYVKINNSNSESNALYQLAGRFVQYGSTDKAHNTPDDPVVLTVNKATVASITRTDTEDWFKVTIPLTGKVTFNVNSCNNTLLFELYNSTQSSQLLSETISGGTYTKAVTKQFTQTLNNGVYYLHFTNETSVSTYQGKYSVQVNATVPVTPAKPTSLKATLKAYNKIGISWTAAKNADSYVLQYKKSTDSAYKLYKTKKGSTQYVTFSKLTPGVLYVFRLRSYNSSSKRYSAWTSTVSLRTLAKPVISSVAKKTSSTVQLTWNAVTGASGYQISVTTKNNTYKVVATVSNKNVSRQIKVNKNVVRYYRVRAFRYVNSKKVFTPWSAYKSFTLS